MTLACVTLTYNGADVTTRLLGSLDRQTDRDFGMIVVDNDSDLHDREQLGGFTAEMSLPVDVITSAENLGFSGGNNLGIRRALANGAEWVVLLNNDTEVEPDFVATLRETLRSHAGIVGLPMVESGTVVRAGRRRWLALSLDHHDAPDDASDAYVVGGAMAIHRTVFERIGLLDDAYFLYFEDVDFSERARRAPGSRARFRNVPSCSTRSRRRPPGSERPCWPATTPGTRSASTARTDRRGSGLRSSRGS